MKHQPFVGIRLQRFFNGTTERRLRRRGWGEVVVPFTGYGTEDHVRVMGRLVLQPAQATTQLGMYAATVLNRRGWRNFVSAPVAHRPVTVRVGDSELEMETDRAGYFDVQVRAHGLSEGWHEVAISTPEADAVKAPVQVVSSKQTFGIISDIDDTILSTWLPRLFLAAWNSLVMTEGNRQAVPGMARMYQALLADRPGAPIVYVSTGAWNTLPFLNRFMKRHGYPKGAMLLTDLGPTQTNWFRSGPAHKKHAMFELARDFPEIKWVLVGDDGQHDPALYREFAELAPDHVRLIAIRQLSEAEQLLAHGTPTVLTDNHDLQWTRELAPEVTGVDGDELKTKVQAILASQGDIDSAD